MIQYGIALGESDIGFYGRDGLLKLPNGDILLSGASGKWELFTSSMVSKSSGTWIHETSVIFTSLLLPNGDILLGGGDGKWELFTPSMVSKSSGTWIHGALNIHSSLLLPNGGILLGGKNGRFLKAPIDFILPAPTYSVSTTTDDYYSQNSIIETNNGDLLFFRDNSMDVYDSNMVFKLSKDLLPSGQVMLSSLLLPNGDILIGFYSGKWILIDSSLEIKKTGTRLSNASTRSISMLANGNILLVGGAMWEICDQNMTTIKSGQSTDGLDSSLALPTGDILLAGSNGGWEFFDSEMNLKNSGVLTSATVMIDVLTILPNNEIIMSGGSGGHWEIYDFNMNLKTNGRTYNDINSLIVNNNGTILTFGNGGRWQLLTNTMTNIANGTWVHGSANNIYSAIQLDNGNIVLAGGYGSTGCLQLIDYTFFLQSGVTGQSSNISNVSYGGSNGIIQLPNNDILMVSDNTNWELFDISLKSKKSAQWSHTASIRTSLILKDGDILLAGDNGVWEIFDFLMVSKSVGVWSHVNINIRTSLLLPNGNILLAGDSGKWEILNNGMTSVMSGTWTPGEFNIKTSLLLKNGDILLAGDNGKRQLFDSSMTSKSSGTWAHNATHINSAIELHNSDILLIGDRGRRQLVSATLTTKSSGTWAHGSVNINTSTMLLNGDILLSGSGGKWNIVDFNFASKSSGTWTHGATSNILTSTTLTNGDLLLVGTGGKWEYISRSPKIVNSFTHNIKSDVIPITGEQKISWSLFNPKHKMRISLMDNFSNTLYTTIVDSIDKEYIFNLVKYQSVESFTVKIELVIKNSYGYYISKPFYTNSFIISFFTAIENYVLPQPNNIFAKENIDSVRQKVNEFRTLNGLSTVSWTDPDIIKKGTPVKAVHMNEIQQAIAEVYTQTQTELVSQVKPMLDQEVKAKDITFPIKEYGNRLYNIVRALKNQ